jgi:hypothetical protein
MNSFSPLFIPVNRRKMVIMTIVYGLLGLCACLLTYYIGANQSYMSHTVFKVAAVIVFAFFAVVAGTFAKNIKNDAAGVEISSKGINDHSSSISPGMISWKEIKSISTAKNLATSYLLIHVKHPQEIIKKAKNKAVKRLLEQNMTIYKTPVVVNVGSLSTSLKEMESNVDQFYQRFGAK